MDSWDTAGQRIRYSHVSSQPKWIMKYKYQVQSISGFLCTDLYVTHHYILSVTLKHDPVQKKGLVFLKLHLMIRINARDNVVVLALCILFSCILFPIISEFWLLIKIFFFLI